MNATPAAANVRISDLVKSDGTPIIAGTVNFYIQALTGANVGKFFRESDDSWQAAETVCGAMTHTGDGHWEITVSAACWIDGVVYRQYAKESGALHIPYSEQFLCAAASPTAVELAAAVVGDAAFLRLLALSGEFRRVTNIVYSGSEVSSATIKIYASQAAFDADTPSKTIAYSATIVAGKVTGHQQRAS